MAEEDGVAALAELYRQRLPLLESLSSMLQSKATQALHGLQHIDRISFRVKDSASFASKCLPVGRPPRYAHPLREVEDQVAGRILVFFAHDVSIVHDRLADYFNLVEAERKRPERAAEFGYESDHLVVTIAEHHKPPDWVEDDMPVTFELQIRTLFMHAWAEPQHDLGYKPGGTLSHEEQRMLAWGAASAWGADRSLEDAWQKLGNPIDCAS